MSTFGSQCTCLSRWQWQLSTHLPGNHSNPISGMRINPSTGSSIHGSVAKGMRQTVQCPSVRYTRSLVLLSAALCQGFWCSLLPVQHNCMQILTGCAQRRMCTMRFPDVGKCMSRSADDLQVSLPELAVRHLRVATYKHSIHFCCLQVLMTACEVCSGRIPTRDEHREPVPKHWL
jgi:hypothetical protein